MADPHPLYPQLPARDRGAVDAALDLLYVVAYGTSHEVEADGLLRSARAELEHLIPAGPLVEDSTPDAEEAAERERWIRQQVKVSQHDPSMGERAMGWAVGEIDRLRVDLALTIHDFLAYLDERGIRLTTVNPRLDEPYTAAAVNGYLAGRAVLARRADGGA